MCAAHGDGAHHQSGSLRNKTLFDVLCSTKKHIFYPDIKNTHTHTHARERDRYWTPWSANANTCYRLWRRIFAMEKPSKRGRAFPAYTQGKSVRLCALREQESNKSECWKTAFMLRRLRRLFVSEKWRIRSICAFPSAFNWWQIHITFERFICRKHRADVWSNALLLWLCKA